MYKDVQKPIEKLEAHARMEYVGISRHGDHRQHSRFSIYDPEGDEQVDCDMIYDRLCGNVIKENQLSLRILYEAINVSLRTVRGIDLVTANIPSR